ncbi:MAG: ethanolamine utilization protein EutH [Clostridia bacterium]|nr:ethanolamine utilization protein EutH [Clostridia bacterium]
MSFYEIILLLAAVGAVIGGVDHLAGNRFRLGEKFIEGFNIMSTLAISSAGIIVLAPVLVEWLEPVLVPVFRFFRADPSMFASIIANDMGGYPLAMLLAENQEMGLMSGLITSSMLGCTLVFSLPVGMGIISADDRPHFIRGLLLGLIAIPIGSIVGGLCAGFDPRLVLINHIPVVLLSLLLAAGFLFIPKIVLRGAAAVGKGVGALSIIGIVIGAVAHLSGRNIPFFENIDTLMNALSICAGIAVVLIGILPLMELLTRLLNAPLNALGKLLGVNAASASGLIYTLANPVPTFSLLKDMDVRGKIINTAWLTCAAAALGDHLGFTAGVAPEMIAPLVVGKLAGGAVALLLALWQTRKEK